MTYKDGTNAGQEGLYMFCIRYIALYPLHPGIWEMSDLFIFQIISLIRVPGMKG